MNRIQVSIIITLFFALSYASAYAQVPFRKGLHKPAQLRYPRVQEAYQLREGKVLNHFKIKNLAQDLKNEIYLRIIKNEQCLEVWVRSEDQKIFHWYDTYFFCSYIGELGPKLEEGDFQIPEGFYKVDRFNPESDFHLSMGINYPNKADRVRSTGKNPGSDIFIHGSCVTVGCIPVGDELIQEVYILVVEAINAGYTNIPVHIYPFRMTEDNFAKIKKSHPETYDQYEKLWRSMQPAYQLFEDYYLVPEVEISGTGFTVKPAKDKTGYEFTAQPVKK